MKPPPSCPVVRAFRSEEFTYNRQTMIFRTRFFDGGKESAFVEGSSFRTSFIDNKKDGNRGVGQEKKEDEGETTVSIHG